MEPRMCNKSFVACLTGGIPGKGKYLFDLQIE